MQEKIRGWQYTKPMVMTSLEEDTAFGIIGDTNRKRVL